jgi:hypothetical protein
MGIHDGEFQYAKGQKIQLALVRTGGAIAILWIKDKWNRGESRVDIAFSTGYR